MIAIRFRNFLVQYSDFNNIYVLETNGFRVEDVVSRWSREYGVLSFTSDNGLYNRVKAYGAGDSGIYPGSGPEGHCKRYGIEVSHSESFGNTIGWSGTAGNGVYTHDSKFHHNSAGITMDSFASGHPGMPQDCSKWGERNRIYSNNADLFNSKRDAYCQNTPNETTTGVAGPCFWVPAEIRGTDPTGQSAEPSTYDTSHENKYVGNRMGIRPDGRRAPNGVDFWWDEGGHGNCWSKNKGIRSGGAFTSDPLKLFPCPGGSPDRTGSSRKFAELIPCSTWDPQTNPDPVGCNWFTRPSKPR